MRLNGAPQRWKQSLLTQVPSGQVILGKEILVASVNANPETEETHRGTHRDKAVISGPQNLQPSLFR